jgi:hypothetical protein
MLDKEDRVQTRKTAYVMPEGCGATIDLGAREFDGAWRRGAEPKSYNYAGTYDCLTCVGVNATKRSFEHNYKPGKRFLTHTNNSKFHRLSTSLYMIYAYFRKGSNVDYSRWAIKRVIKD